MKPSTCYSPWKKLWFFPWLEYRTKFYQYGFIGGSVLQTKERLWRWYQEPKPEPIKSVELPPQLLFDWKRDYGPLWKPGSKAFWLEPEPDDLPAGEWPLPTIKQRPGVTVDKHGVIFYDDDLSYFTPKVYVRIYGT